MFAEFPKWIDLPGDVRKIVHSAEEEVEELKAWIEAEAGETDNPVTDEVPAKKKNTK